MTGSADQLREIEREASGCSGCSLAATRSRVVFGEGPADANVMFVGEAPGRLEDESGRPFCGRSGLLLDQLLEEAGIARSDCYITSVVKCRPPENRDPKRPEIEACSRWLEGQLRLVAPRIVCTLGNFALRRLTGGSAGITAVHGRPQGLPGRAGEIELIPLFHPAAALRSTGTRELLAADLRLVADRIALLG